MSGQQPNPARQIINGLNAQLIDIPANKTLVQIQLELFPQTQREFGNVNFNPDPNNLILNTYQDNVKLKEITNDVNALLPDNSPDENIQIIINIIVNLQTNLVTINRYNNNTIPQNIITKYIKYIQYLQKIIIVKLWKDMKILELFLLMFKEDGIVNTLINNLFYFHNRVENVQIDTTLGNSNFNNETKNENDLIGGVTKAYNTCLQEISNILSDFVKPVSGGQQGGDINVQIINNTTEDDINNHIINLNTYKRDFENALQTNIKTFENLCEIFKNILSEILNRITTYTNTKVVRKYIKIGGLEETLRELNNNNGLLMNKLTVYSNNKLNDLPNSPNIAPPPPAPPASPPPTQPVRPPAPAPPPPPPIPTPLIIPTGYIKITLTSDQQKAYKKYVGLINNKNTRQDQKSEYIQIQNNPSIEFEIKKALEKSTQLTGLFTSNSDKKVTFPDIPYEKLGRREIGGGTRKKKSKSKPKSKSKSKPGPKPGPKPKSKSKSKK